MATTFPLSQESLREMYSLMWRVRWFEETAYRLYMDGELPGFLHSSVGQEAVSVGACSALQPADAMASTHRGHGDTIAKGAEVGSAMAELFGRETGICRGKGGSMHIADFGKHILGANGVVAAGLPISLGSALAAKIKGTDTVTLAFFGDGAVASGPTHESFNIAVLWDLPIVFVRQNNQYAESTPRSEFEGIPDVVTWAEGYGMSAARVDGNDVIAVYDEVAAAVDRARSGSGPSFVECETYRWYGHNIGDPGTERPKEEVADWKLKDPIPRFGAVLMASHGFSEDELESIKGEEKRRVDDAANAARNDPIPNSMQAYEDVYVDKSVNALAIGGSR